VARRTTRRQRKERAQQRRMDEAATARRRRAINGVWTIVDTAVTGVVWNYTFFWAGLLFFIAFGLLGLAASERWLHPGETRSAAWERTLFFGALVFFASFGAAAIVHNGDSAGKASVGRTMKVPFVVPTASSATGAQQLDFSSNYSQANCSPSQVDPDRKDAYRCSSYFEGKKETFDACFWRWAPSLGRGLYCATSPFPYPYRTPEGKTIGEWQMRFLVPRPSQSFVSTSPPIVREASWDHPWGMKLDNGIRCVQGLTVFAGDAPGEASYECFNTPESIPLERTRKDFVGWITDYEQGKPYWTAHLLRQHAEGADEIQKVVEVRR